MSSFQGAEIADRSHPHSPAYIYNAAPRDVTAVTEADTGPPTPVVTTIPAVDSDVTNIPSWLSAFVEQSGSTPTPTPDPTHVGQSPSLLSVTPRPVTETRVPKPQQGGSGHEALSRDAKIGLAIAIAVAIVLTIFAIGFCMFDCKGRRRQRRESSGVKRVSNSSWGTDFGHSTRNSRAEGPWTRITAGERLDKDHDLGDVKTRNSMLDEYERRLQNVGFWEPMDAPRSLEQGRAVNQDQHALPRAHESVPEFLPVYIPSERFSWGSTTGQTFAPPPIVSASAPVLPRYTADEKEMK